MGSARSFKSITQDGNHTSQMAFSLEDIVKNHGDYEIYYALDDVLDQVLDLKVEETMYFQPNRDNKMSKGILLRIQ